MCSIFEPEAGLSHQGCGGNWESPETCAPASVHTITHSCNKRSLMHASSFTFWRCCCCCCLLAFGVCDSPFVHSPAAVWRTKVCMAGGLSWRHFSWVARSESEERVSPQSAIRDQHMQSHSTPAPDPVTEHVSTHAFQHPSNSATTKKKTTTGK